MITVQVSKMGMISFLREFRVEWGDTHTRVLTPAQRGVMKGMHSEPPSHSQEGLRVDKEGLSEGWHLTSGLKDR